LIFEKMREEGYVSGTEDVRLTIEILVPSTQVGRIIGKGGQNVRELQRVTGSVIKLSEQQATPPSAEEETTVHIIGPFFSVQVRELIFSNDFPMCPRTCEVSFKFSIRFSFMNYFGNLISKIKLKLIPRSAVKTLFLHSPRKGEFALWFFNRMLPEELVVLAHVPVAVAAKRAALALRETAVLLLKAVQHRSRVLSNRQLAHHLASSSNRSSRSNSSNSSRHRHNRRRPSNIDDLHLTTRTDAKNAYPFYSTSGFVVALTFPLVERPSLSRPASLFAGDACDSTERGGSRAEERDAWIARMGRRATTFWELTRHTSLDI